MRQHDSNKSASEFTGAIQTLFIVLTSTTQAQEQDPFEPYVGTINYLYQAGIRAAEHEEVHLTVYESWEDAESALCEYFQNYFDSRESELYYYIMHDCSLNKNPNRSHTDYLLISWGLYSQEYDHKVNGKDNDNYGSLHAQTDCHCSQEPDPTYTYCEDRIIPWGEFQFLSEGLVRIQSNYNKSSNMCVIEKEIEPQCPIDSKLTIQTKVGNPIDCADGIKKQTEQDYKDINDLFTMERTYSSSSAGSNEVAQTLAHRWTTTVIPKLTIEEITIDKQFATVYLSRGVKYTFALVDGAWETTSSEFGSFETLSDGYEYTSINDVTYKFDFNGTATKKIQKNGRFLTYNYPNANQVQVTDNYNKTYTLALEEFGSGERLIELITQFIDPAGNEYNYIYDELGYLIEVIYPDLTPHDVSDNPRKTYEYKSDLTGSNRLLVGVIDENGNRYATYDYDEQNRGILSYHGVSADRLEIDYLDGEASSQSVVKNYRNSTDFVEAIFDYARLNGVNKVTKYTEKECATCNEGIYQYTYNGAGVLSTVVDSLNNVTKYVFNSHLLFAKREAYGTALERYTSISWNTSILKPSIVKENDKWTFITYDQNENIVSRRVEDRVTGKEKVESYTYDENGKRLTANGPRTDVTDITTYEYDNTGNLIKITNPMGHETLFTSHDAHGKPLSIMDANGVETTITYHPRGWITEVTKAGDTTSYGYDSAGNLTSIDLPNGIVLHYEYDSAHRLTAISDTTGNRLEYTLDNFGNQITTEIKDSGGILRKRVKKIYDNLSRLTQIIGSNNQVWNYAYDSNGNLIEETNPLNNSGTYEFDALGRLQKVKDPSLGETNITYDVYDNIVAITDATNLTTSYEYDALGDLKSVISPDTGTTTYSHDSAGNVINKTNALGVSTTYSYDALNRISSVIYPDSSENVTFSYDSTLNENYGIGKLTGVIDGSGSTELIYDQKGSLTSERKTINGNSFITDYQYDPVGMITQITYPSGRTIEYIRNNNGQITSITSELNGNYETIASGITYLPFGPLVSLTYGNNKTLTQEFDQDYRLATKSISGISDLNYSYTLNNNIDSITDTLDSFNDQFFSYDLLDRLTDATGQYGANNYSFDAIGNRLSKSENGNIEDYEYSTDSHQLLEINNTSLTYDATGSTLTKGNTSFNYNQAERLSSVHKTNLDAKYIYNFKGQRVKKVVETEDITSTSLYHYDQYNRLISETDGQGNVLAEYIYLDEMRIAIFQKLGLSEVIVDDDQAVFAGKWADISGDQLYNGSAKLADKLKKNGSNGKGKNGSNGKGKGGSNGKGKDGSNGKGKDGPNSANAEYSVSLNNGMYDVYTRWQSDPKNATDATYKISHSNGESSISVNQQENGGNWNLLGQFKFDGVATVAIDNDANGSVIADAIRFIPSEEIFYVHTDHIDRPSAVTDKDGAIKWKGYYDPHGNLTAVVDDIKQNLRFPGQYYDEETGLHYNYFRDYDPEIGRYIQSDPIGLNGGINTYGYVYQNPLNYTDFYGLSGFRGIPTNAEEAKELYGGGSPGCLMECIGKQLGMQTATGAGMAASGVPVVPYPRSGLGAASSTGATSIASSGLSKAFPQRLPVNVPAPTMTNLAAKTRVVGRAAGRWVPIVGWGILLYDAGAIMSCVSECEDKDNNGQCDINDTGIY